MITTPVLDADAVTALSRSFDGVLVGPADPDYDAVRQIWNGLIDRRPALVARCTGVADVTAVLRFAQRQGIPFTVRGGGHNVAGSALMDGGLVVDLSWMRDVAVDVGGRRASAQGGATWADVDAVTQLHGLATPGGVVSQTGIGGLTLGGGIGWLRREHGLACDNLVGAQLVTADGTVREVSADHDAELFWALRGGGGGIGVVTRFDFRLHEVGPDVFVAFTVYGADRGADVLRGYRQVTDGLADAVSSLLMCGTVPEAEEFPRDAWGSPCVMVVGCATGNQTTAETLAAPLRELGDPLADLSGSMPYFELQQLFDADYPDGLRYHWKSLYLPGLSDDVIDLALSWSATRPSPLSTVDVWHLGGQMARVPADATAFGDRSAPYLLGIEANWSEPSMDEANVAWVRGCFEAFREVAGDRQYLNFPGFFEQGERMRRTAHGEANFERLMDLRQRVDPHGLSSVR